MSKVELNTHYHDYLKIDQLLDCQHLKSIEAKAPAHDEMLFIIVHQTYELWFKQLIFELESINSIFTEDTVDEKNMGVIASRCERIIKILNVLHDQIHVLETMTPLDFLEFRNLLYPASGFQSFQFRCFENLLGLAPQQRMPYNNKPYHTHFSDSQKQQLTKIENGQTLFTAVEAWLERTPFLNIDGFNFWDEYTKSVENMFAEERDIISRNHLLTESDKENNYKIISESEKVFSALLNENEYNKIKDEGHWRLSFKAVQAALLIQLYRDQPIFQLPFKLLTSILDIDETITSWRYRHALLARRMLGAKVGTGGSSGAKYLSQSTEQHKIFNDFFKLTTFLIPRSHLPKLPKSVEKKLGFNY